jgi:hypothetical protein
VPAASAGVLGPLFGECLAGHTVAVRRCAVLWCAELCCVPGDG